MTALEFQMTFQDATICVEALDVLNEMLTRFGLLEPPLKIYLPGKTISSDHLLMGKTFLSLLKVRALQPLLTISTSAWLFARSPSRAWPVCAPSALPPLART
jgi:hypothetical protein